MEIVEIAAPTGAPDRRERRTELHAEGTRTRQFGPLPRARAFREVAGLRSWLCPKQFDVESFGFRVWLIPSQGLKRVTFNLLGKGV